MIRLLRQMKIAYVAVRHLLRRWIQLQNLPMASPTAAAMQKIVVIFVISVSATLVIVRFRYLRNLQVSLPLMSN